MKNIILSYLSILALLTPKVSSANSPDWVEHMQKVHADFDGEVGYVAQYGDSITYSMAFWSPMGWSDPSQYLKTDDGLPYKPDRKRWRDVILGAKDKGPEHGNFSGWTSRQIRKAVEKILPKRKPEIAIIMAGSNDIRGGDVPNKYRENIEAIIDTCIAEHCIPILNTIPPFRNRDSAVNEANEIIREIAKKKKVPLADYHAACMEYRPGNSWDGTIISKDGVHPTADKTHDYSEENLKNSGYALRNWVNFLVYRAIYFKVLHIQDNKNK